MILSKNDGKLNFADDFNDKTLNVEDARNALISIAIELQRLEVEESSLNRTDDDEILDKLHICTTKMQAKNRHLKKLHRNLKIACTVAKILMSAKNRETKLLEDQLNLKRDECSNLLQTHAENICLIEKLEAENAHVYQEVERVSEIIHLGYKEVQKFRHETPKDVPVLMGLKEILTACGQYYVDLCNERERCTELERRNRFLQNKIAIMKNNLAACKEEIQNLKIKNVRLTRSNALQVNIKLPLQLKRDTTLTPKSINDETSSQLAISKSQINIVSHLSAIKDLLCDQDNMLRDLRKLSEELGASEF